MKPRRTSFTPRILLLGALITSSGCATHVPIELVNSTDQVLDLEITLPVRVNITSKDMTSEGYRVIMDANSTWSSSQEIRTCEVQPNGSRQVKIVVWNGTRRRPRATDEVMLYLHSETWHVRGRFEYAGIEGDAITLHPITSSGNVIPNRAGEPFRLKNRIVP